MKTLQVVPMVTLSLQLDGQIQSFGEKTDNEEDTKKYTGESGISPIPYEGSAGNTGRIASRVFPILLTV